MSEKLPICGVCGKRCGSYVCTEIKVLSFLEAVRKRPGMYIGDLHDPTLPARLVQEAFCHAIDEMVEGTCDEVHLHLEPTLCTLKYNSPMSLDKVGSQNETRAYRMVASLAACSNLKKNIEIGDEYCKLGLAVLNAMSDTFTCYVREKDRSIIYRFNKGVLEKMNEPEEASWIRDDHYTLLTFSPFGLIPNCTFKNLSLESFVEELANKFPNVRFKYERKYYG